jgi:hypothetical protein
VAIQDVFGAVLDSRIEISPQDRVVAAVLLKEELSQDFDPSSLIRAAWLVGTAPDEACAERVLSVFADDVELLASVCMSLVRHLRIAWDGHLESLGAALLCAPRGRTARAVLADRLCRDLQPISQKAWSLTGGGVMLLDLIDDPVLLADLVGKGASTWRLMRRLAELGEVGTLLSSARAVAGRLSPAEWALVARPLPPGTRREFLLALLGRIRADQRLRAMVQEELEKIDLEVSRAD